MSGCGRGATGGRFSNCNSNNRRESGALLLLAFAPLLTWVSPPVLRAQVLPAGYALTDLVPSGITNPTCVAAAPDGRIFIGLKTGAIVVYSNRSGLAPVPFHTLTTSSCAEGGLIGLALDPDFASNGFVYVHYTMQSCAPTRISRITALTPDADVSDPDSELVLLSLDRQSGIHNAGGLCFGPGGKLYISVGEKTTGTSQMLNTLYGKILRINPDGTIPSDNPTSFAGVSGSPEGIYRAIWAIGFRNPFRFAIHPETGRVFVNDVSDSGREEINDVVAGANYGYPTVQGTFNQTQYPSFTQPILSYPQSTPGIAGNCIVGGTFYSPPESPYPPENYGEYFFADLSTGSWIKRIHPDTHVITSFASSINSVVDFDIDPQGRLIFVRHYANKLYRLDYTPPLAPTIVRQPQDAAGCVTDGVTLEVSVSASPPVTYVWRRDDLPLSDGGGISGSGTRALRIAGAVAAQGGAYRCYVQNAAGNALSAQAVVTIGSATDANDGGAIKPFVEAALASSVAEDDRCRFDFDGDGHVGPGDVESMAAALVAD